MNLSDVLKHIENLEKELSVLKKAIISEYVPEEKPKVDSAEQERQITAKKIIEFLNQEYQTKFSVTAKTNVKSIVARLREGYTFDDFVLVIKDRKEKWGEDPKMCDYLCPTTLFGTKFDKYLNIAKKTNKNNIKSFDSNEVEAELLRRIAG